MPKKNFHFVTYGDKDQKKICKDVSHQRRESLSLKSKLL